MVAADEREAPVAPGVEAAAAITAVRHIALTVTDLERSAAWYAEVLGFTELFRESNAARSAVIMRIPGADVIVGLVRFADGGDDRFSPRRTGLDHVCFAVASRDDLLTWPARLDQFGVDHSGVVESGRGSMINFKDPDGIALALAAPRSRA